MDPPDQRAARLTRRQVLEGAAGAAVLGGAAFGAVRLLGGSRADAIAAPAPARGAARHFQSRPDLRPPETSIAGASAELGYLFLGVGWKDGVQGGPLIVDTKGQLVWFKPLSPTVWAANFTASDYLGRPVLTWWEGSIEAPLGYGRGEAVILDSSYRELERIRAARGRQMDMHEFRLTPEGTALFTCYPQPVQSDLTEIGGPSRGRVLESVIQEVDLRTGRLLMEWRSLDHIPVSESYRSLHDPYDYLHINSIDVAPDGNLLISGRDTWATYKLDRRTGEVIWRLGGKRSDYGLANGAQFAWQHDARHANHRTITVFDNGSDGRTNTEVESRAVVFELDSRSRKARLAGSYRHPRRRLLSTAMGSLQVLPGGNLVVGWGSQPYVSEFTADGTLALDVALTPGQQSYRSFRLPWNGTPAEAPAIVTRRDSRSDKRTLYASWNGATGVSSWQLSAGPSARRLAPVGVVRCRRFETAIPLGTTDGHAMVTALDSSGRPLASSGPVRL